MSQKNQKNQINQRNPVENFFPKTINELKRYIRDPLYKNSFFIMLTSTSGAVFGFIFWMLAARLYSKEDVGIATALISSLSLLILLSRFGLDQSIIRFFPEKHKSKVFGTSLIITTFFAILFGVIFTATIDIWSPELHLVKRYIFLYLLFLAANSVASLTGTAFTALRKSEYYFIQNLLAGSRVVFLFPFVFFGALGIFSSVGISLLLALIFSLPLLASSGVKHITMDTTFLGEAFCFSVGNYIAGLLITIPNQILPIMVLNILGAEETAHYYIVFTIASLMFIIPGAVSTSLFVEGSHKEDLRKTTLKSAFVIFFLLIPIVIILYFFGGFLLRIMGKDYAEAFNLLKVMALSSFLVATSQIYFSIKKVQKDVKGLIFLSSLLFVLLIGLSYVFMFKFGIVGIGYAWISSYGLGSSIVGLLVKRGQ